MNKFKIKKITLLAKIWEPFPTWGLGDRLICFHTRAALTG